MSSNEEVKRLRTLIDRIGGAASASLDKESSYEIRKTNKFQRQRRRLPLSKARALAGEG